ncbi:MAG TPA: ABC transporter permease [Roseiflexaceae bacterium]|nr:ABC transporter permease [Roseiflexaceae bacterium]
MLSPRWRKVLRDLWSNKTRTVLVVLSIAVGVFAIALVSGSQAIMRRELAAAYAAINPVHAQIAAEPFDDNLVQAVRHVPGVRDAQGHLNLSVRVRTGPETWQQLGLTAFSDYADIRINKVRPEAGAWPPPNNQLVIERASLSLLKANIGDTVTVELPGGKQRQMRIAGTAYDLNLPPAPLIGRAFGFIAMDTAEWLGQERKLTELNVVFDGQPQTGQDVEVAARRVRDKIENSGHTVTSTYIPTPGKHPADEIIAPLMLLLGALGVLSLLASGFLVVNTISALLMQQLRQIGVMKAIGARTRQIMGMYMVTALLFGVLALLVALPLGALGAYGFSRFMSGAINTDFADYRIPNNVLAVEVAVGLLAPVLAALWPVIAGTRITVREAIASYGLGKGRFGKGRIDRLLERVHGLSRPLLLSLRNTFRRKGRLALTLSTLTLSGLIFVAVFSVRSSLLLTLEDALNYFNYDVSVSFERPYRLEQIEQVAQSVPGVTAVESWGFSMARRERPNDTESDNLYLFAPPAETRMLKPTVLQGRWLLPQDENALVINTTALKGEPDIKVGDEITLRIDGRETSWQVVGIVKGIGGGSFVYANYPYYAQVVRLVGRAGSVQITTDRRDTAAQAELAKELRQRLEAAGMRVTETQTIATIREQNAFIFNIIVAFLMVMALLLAIVGGMGLMGTMSINVLERTREIGVLRAIGASNGAVLRIVLAEGLLIGALSWLLGAIFAIPVSMLLCNAVGVLLFQTPLSYTFSFAGALSWLALVLLIAGLASALPARGAVRLTVRDVLAYEG